jgi:hypothetical protein
MTTDTTVTTDPTVTTDTTAPPEPSTTSTTTPKPKRSTVVRDPAGTWRVDTVEPEGSRCVEFLAGASTDANLLCNAAPATGLIGDLVTFETPLGLAFVAVVSPSVTSGETNLPIEGMQPNLTFPAAALVPPGGTLSTPAGQLVALVDDPRVDRWRQTAPGAAVSPGTDGTQDRYTYMILEDPAGTGRRMLAYFPGPISVATGSQIDIVAFSGTTELGRVTLDLPRT